MLTRPVRHLNRLALHHLTDHPEPVEGPLPNKQHAAPTQPAHPEPVEGPLPNKDNPAQTLGSEYQTPDNAYQTLNVGYQTLDVGSHTEDCGIPNTRSPIRVMQYRIFRMRHRVLHNPTSGLTDGVRGYKRPNTGSLECSILPRTADIETLQWTIESFIGNRGYAV